MQITNTSVSNMENAFRGMRNPLESWDKSDSGICKGGDNGIGDEGCTNCHYQGKCGHSYDYEWKIGVKDMDLAQRLVLSGTDHSKFMRQIFVSCDITAPLYWYSEYDTYKVGTVANSTSKMHKLASTPITINCFEHDDNLDTPDGLSSTSLMFQQIIDNCEKLRQLYNETQDKRYWRALIQLLPESWLQTRTCTMSYANLRSMYFARHNHKLKEWHYFCDWIKSLPYAHELITIERKG